VIPALKEFQELQEPPVRLAHKDHREFKAYLGLTEQLGLPGLKELRVSQERMEQTGLMGLQALKVFKDYLGIRGQLEFKVYLAIPGQQAHKAQ
jgi:hypothetical protein